MIIAYLSRLNFQPETITRENTALLEEAVWIDLLNPTKKEEHQVEKIFAMDIPTRAEMREIEPSNRLYTEDGAFFMTATMVEKSKSLEPKTDAVTFVIKNNKLITVRYIEPHAFDLFIKHLQKKHVENYSATHLIIDLLEASVDRLADIFERVGRSLDGYSQTIFRTKQSRRKPLKLDYRHILQEIGTNGDLNTKAWESLMSFSRLSVFFTRMFSTQLNEGMLARLESITKDINALSEHAKFLVTKVNFLLDATLGMVNIEQNNIIKIFSIAAVILLPPTLVASIYGMNFEFIPELKWHYGYPFAILLMMISAWLPYKYFKIRKWL